MFYQRPVEFQQGRYMAQLLEINRLYDVSHRPQPLALGDVGVFLRPRQDDDGNLLGPFFRPMLRKTSSRLPSADSSPSRITDGPSSGLRLRIFATAKKVTSASAPSSTTSTWLVNRALLNGFQRHGRVVRVVFHQQEFSRSWNCRPSLRFVRPGGAASGRGRPQMSAAPLASFSMLWSERFRTPRSTSQT